MDFTELTNTLDHFFTYPIFTIKQTPITLSSLTFFAIIMCGFFDHQQSPTKVSPQPSIKTDKNALGDSIHL